MSRCPKRDMAATLLAATNSVVPCAADVGVVCVGHGLAEGQHKDARQGDGCQESEPHTHGGVDGSMQGAVAGVVVLWCQRLGSDGRGGQGRGKALHMRDGDSGNGRHSLRCGRCCWMN